MKKIILIQLLFLAIGSSDAQRLDTLCPYVTINIPSNAEHIEASLNFEVINILQQKSNAYRNIFFIHGLTGDATAWSKVADACMNSTLSSFPARKCYTHKLDYSQVTKNSIDVPAKNVGLQIKNIANGYQDINPNKGILIAHSQGGIVCRELMHKDFVEGQNYALGNYGGVITVASPLQGAMVLDNRPKIHNMLNGACHALSINTLITATVGPILFPIFSSIGIQLTPTGVCDVVTGPIMKFIASDFYHQITDAYEVNGNNSKIEIYNNDVNNATYCNLPKVAFYTVEPQENILWRTANWMINKPNDVAYFAANDDWKFYNNWILPLYTIYSAASIFNDISYDVNAKILKWTWWCCPVSASTAAIAMATSASVKPLISKGRNWFEGADAQWQVVIGARVYNSKTKKWEVKENDGVVLAESSKNLPCATREPVRIYPYEGQRAPSKGSSHMQVRNDQGIKEHLDNLFKGLYGDFFFTESK